LATPNYGYEKRQKELAKKRKKEDKLKEKTDRKTLGPEDESANLDGQPTEPTSDTQPSTN
jgi:hypothetical protein